MRIVYVSWEFPPDFGGGIGTFVDAISRAMARRGHDVTVVTTTRDAIPCRESCGRLTVVRLPWPQASGPEPGATISSWQQRSEAVATFLRRMLGADGFDVVEFADYRGEGFAFVYAQGRAARPPCVVRLHTPLSVLSKYNHSAAPQSVLASFENAVLAQADFIVSPSQALAREMRAHIPDMPEVRLSPHPVDPSFLTLGAQPTPEGANEVLYVGRLEQRKGVEVLIDAAPRVLDACPDARLALIGGDTELSPRQPSMKAVLLERLPRVYHDRVDMPGRMARDELAKRLQRARLCVFPSLFENFPNTCLEAMALGKAVIGADNSGMAEMLVHGESGFITPSGDADSLADAIIRVYQMPADERDAVGRAARRRAEKEYCPDVVAERIEKQYVQFTAQCAERLTAPPAAPRATAGERVAVVIPCYNHGKFLRATLESVRAQTRAPAECVVVDDGSTDPATLRVLNALAAEGVRVIRQENQGLSAARNTGVRSADAEYFVPLDADDCLKPEFIEKTLAVLRANPSLGYCYADVEFFGAATGGWDCPPYEPRKLLVQNLSVATALVRREAFDLVGGYSTDMVHGFEDWDFWLALLSVGYHGARVPERLFCYRKHADGSMLSNTQKHRPEMIGKMIEHHRTLFAGMMGVALTDKDSMFFEAHNEAWQLRQAIVAAGATPGGAVDVSTIDNEVYQRMLAEAELEFICNSRAWRTIQAVKHNPLYALAARWRWGPEWRRHGQAGDPRERLARVKGSLAYRAIQAAKRLPGYRWYARRKHGANWEQAAPGSVEN